jgi:hypothetical protein
VSWGGLERRSTGAPQNASADLDVEMDLLECGAAAPLFTS